MKTQNNYLKKYRLYFIGSCSAFLILSNVVAQSKSTFEPAQAQKEIQVQLRAYERNLKNGDSVAIGKMYSDDAEMFQNRGPSIIGRNNIVNTFGEMIRDSITGSSFTTTGLWGTNEILVEEGTGYFAHTNGKVVSRGKYLLVWKKENGEWKIFKDTFFSDGSVKK